MRQIKAPFFLFIFAFSCLLAKTPADYEIIPDQNQLKILTPSLKQRTTCKIRLPNGLKAYLISDPSADQSAAALSMEVGAWDDPSPHFGMAHFLEHLLFLGTKTHPEEDGYFKQVREHGGNANARTCPDRTIYFFSVNHPSFLPTLDQFAHFFQDPLFNPNAISRELNAVNQEYDSHLENDHYRSMMVCRETGNPHHPYSHFAIGNKTTLSALSRDDIVSWYRKHYSADHANLVLYSPLSIETLCQVATQYFSPILSHSTPSKSVESPMMSNQQKGALIYIKPIKNSRVLAIEWEMPTNYCSDFTSKPHKLISSILESRHKGSLYDKLKEKKFIETMQTGLDKWSKKNAFYSVEFTLTPEGTMHFNEICLHLFQTLNALRQVPLPTYLSDEIKAMTTLNYAYQSRILSMGFVFDHAYNIIDEPLSTYPQNTLLPTPFDTTQNAAFLDILRPDQALYCLMAPQELTGLHTDKQETWTKTPYSIQKIEAKQLQLWDTASQKNNTCIPKPNPYIPENFHLAKMSDAEPMKTPLLIEDNHYGKIYYMQDSDYQTPEVAWAIHMHSPLLDGSIKNHVLMTLYTEALNDYFAPELSLAGKAHFHVHFHPDLLKLTFFLTGYNDKASLFLTKILSSMKTCTLTEEDFQLKCSLLIDKHENFTKELPIFQGHETMQSLLMRPYIRHEDQAKALKEISYDDFLSFSQKLYTSLYIEAMLMGNMTQVEAQDVWAAIKDTLNFSPFPKQYHTKQSILLLPEDKGPYQVSQASSSLGHAAILTLQAGDFSFERFAISSILGKIFQGEFFKALRTKQQTGYIVQACAKEVEGQLMQTFLVQSSGHESEELIARFELFIENYFNHFETLIPQEKFETVKNNLIITLKRPFPNLSSMMYHLDQLAFKHEGDFNYLTKKIKALEELSYEAFQKAAMQVLSRNNKKRLAVTVKGRPTIPDQSFHYEKITANYLKDQGAYIAKNSIESESQME